MRPHRLVVPLVAVFGGAVGALPALTSGATPATRGAAALPMTASFTTIDDAFEATGGGTTVTIATGGTVSFSYPSGSSMHNVDFGTGAQPTSCELGGTAQTPPIPSSPQRPGWSGSCTFDTPGTYDFHCDMHHFMTGTVIVSDSTGTTSTATTTSTTTSTAASTGPPSTPATTTGVTSTATTPADGYPPSSGPGGSGGSTTATPTTTTPYPTTSTPTSSGSSRNKQQSPLAFAAKRAITVAGSQRGERVTGSIRVSTAGRGGHAVITLRARSGGRAVQVGRLRLRHLQAGRVRFAVAVDHAAAVLLSRSTHVALSVEIVVTGPGGRSVSSIEHVQLRP